MWTCWSRSMKMPRGAFGTLITMQNELAELFGRPVDLMEREGLRNPFRRRRILETRQVIYGRGQG